MKLHRWTGEIKKGQRCIGNEVGLVIKLARSRERERERERKKIT